MTAISSKPEGEPREIVGFRRFVLQALPELWLFRLLTGLLLIVPFYGITTLIRLLANTTGAAITNANLRLLLSWRSPIIFALFTLLVFAYIVIELLAQFYLCEDILSGRQVSIFRELKRGFLSLKLFLNPAGIGIIIYILLAVPLCRIGFSVSLTSSFYLPKFITEVIYHKPLYLTLYIIGFTLMVIWGVQSFFAIHGILIDGLHPRAAKRQSRQIIKKHWKDLIQRGLLLFVVTSLIIAGSYLLFKYLPDLWLEQQGADIPRGYDFDLFSERFTGVLSDMDTKVINYRIVSGFTVILGVYIYTSVSALCFSNVMLQVTKMYFIYTDREPEVYFKPSQAPRTIAVLVIFFTILAGMFVWSLASGIAFPEIFQSHEPTKIIAHRAGGNLAVENSLEGIDAAAREGCAGSEVDVQRTLDQHYIISHDKTFERIAGVKKKPSQMTLEEIRAMDLYGTEGKIPTVEEMLDKSKGRLTLFLELKGESADEQMVDDLASLIKERNMENEVVLISLKYRAIDYAETTYPELQTGVLIFLGLGDISRLNCDYIFMEEEMASALRFQEVRNAGKKSGVWTLNRRDELLKYLDSGADYVITDAVRLAEEVQGILSRRTDSQLMRDRVERMIP